MLKKIGLGLVALVLVFVVVVATRPSEFHIERSATVAAPADVAYAFVNDFHQWGQWSPWEKLDPAMKKTFEGPASGVGAKYAWVGNDQVGEGRMTIEQAKANESVVIKLEFLKPFAATNTATFTFQADGANVRVTWAMDGHNNFVSKAFSMFMDMDKMIGSDFERGLAGLKTLAEAEAAKRAEEAKKAAEAAAAAAAAAAPADAAPADGTAPAVTAETK